MLAVWDFEACQQVIFEVSDKVGADLAALLPDPQDARGFGIVISREGRLKTGRYLVRALEGAAELVREEFWNALYDRLELPEPADLVEALEATARRCGVCDLVRTAPETRGEVGGVVLPGFADRAERLKAQTHSLNP